MKAAAGIVCEHNCLSLTTAADEMQAVAAQNARVRDPVYHVVLSWPEGESPSDDQAFACGAHVRASVGMDGHQSVMAIHRDTHHVHAHLAVNRINPITYKAVYPDRDYFKLDRAMRELELRFGWKHDRGPYAVFERNGIKVVDWASKAKSTKEHMPSAAADMERHADQESFFSYLRGEPRTALLSALRDEEMSWPGLHHVLARFGVSLRERGQGFAVYDALPGADRNGCIKIKASDVHEELSKARLERRLGTFEPAGVVEPPEQSYNPFRPPRRDPVRRELRRQQRADARRDLRDRFRQFSASLVAVKLDPQQLRSRLDTLRSETRQRRLAARLEPDRARRKVMLSVIAFEAARERQRLIEASRKERAELRLLNGRTRQAYREWVEHRAAEGDGAAIGQLRGWAYAAQRGRKANGEVWQLEANGFRSGGSSVDDEALLIPALAWKVRRDGTIRYQVDGGGSITDRGDTIDMVAGQLPLEAVRQALAVASKRFGDDVIVEGSAAFRELVAALRAPLLPSDERLRMLALAAFDAPQVGSAPRPSSLKPNRT